MLPKSSVGKGNSPTDVASEEALRQGGFVGLAEEEPFLTQETGKGQAMAYFPLEVDALLESWDSDRNRSRRLVPLSRIEKFADRATLKVVRMLVEDYLGLAVA